MKLKVSISMEEQTLESVKNKVKEGLFRNNSHLVEFAVNEFLKGNER